VERHRLGRKAMPGAPGFPDVFILTRQGGCPVLPAKRALIFRFGGRAGSMIHLWFGVTAIRATRSARQPHRKSPNKIFPHFGCTQISCYCTSALFTRCCVCCSSFFLVDRETCVVFHLSQLWSLTRSLLSLPECGGASNLVWMVFSLNPAGNPSYLAHQRHRSPGPWTRRRRRG
jgi:hypothetical protein